MSTLDLNSIDEFLLKQIVKKFTFPSGVSFYRSCRYAKNLVGCLKPAWYYPLSLEYMNNKRTIRDGETNKELSRNFSADKLCRIADVVVHDCDTSFIKEVVLPELEALGAVVHFKLYSCQSDEDVRLMLAAAKPKYASIFVGEQDPMSDGLKNVPVLTIHLDSMFGQIHPFWTTNEVFELLRNRKLLVLWLGEVSEAARYPDHKKIVVDFLKNWLKDVSTYSSLAPLWIFKYKGNSTNDGIDAMLEDAGAQSLMKSLVKTDKGYIMERETGHRLGIAQVHRGQVIIFKCL